MTSASSPPAGSHPKRLDVRTPYDVGWRSMLLDFFAVDVGDWERRPAADAQRKDVALTLVFLLCSALGLELARSAAILGDHRVWTEYLALVVMALPILVRRRTPVLALMASSIAFFVIGLTMPDMAAQLSVQLLYFFSLFSAMAWARSRRVVLSVMGAVLLLMFGWLSLQYALGHAVDSIRERVGVAAPEGMFGSVAAVIVYSFLVNVLYFGGAVIGGQAAWRAARSRAALDAQAETLRGQAEQLGHHAVVQERMRIARELHDVVAQHVSVMGIQAAGARRVLERDPVSAGTALTAVETSAREAVTEMRTLLGTLRGSDAHAAEVDRSPEPGLSAIDGLVEQLRAPGFEVTYDVVESRPGVADTVPPAVGLTLFRTVQEAVANVRRHSTARRAGVVLRVERTEAGGFAEVEVLDDGRPRGGTSGSGLGLLGMRERVASLDGALEIGPRVAGGYRVRVRLPLVGTAEH